MNAFHFEHSIGDSVCVTIEGVKIRWCTITSVKFEEKNIKCDILLSKGGKLYDVDSSKITSTASEGLNQLIEKF